MCDLTEALYSPNDVVWVKLGPVWWPGRVCSEEEIPPEIMKDLRKTPIAIVKFFQEDSFEYVKSLSNIYHYNCKKKYEFIKKGLDMLRSKNRGAPSNMKLFPEDIVRAESLTNGNTAILQNSMFQPEEKPSYTDLFATTKKTPKKVKSDAKKTLTPVKQNTPRFITHPRFLQLSSGQSTDYEVRERKQEPIRAECDEVDTTPPTLYRCTECDYTTTRLNVIVWHNKSHIRNYATPQVPRKATKRKSTTSVKFKERASTGSINVGYKIDDSEALSAAKIPKTNGTLKVRSPKTPGRKKSTVTVKKEFPQKNTPNVQETNSTSVAAARVLAPKSRRNSVPKSDEIHKSLLEDWIEDDIEQDIEGESITDENSSATDVTYEKAALASDGLAASRDMTPKSNSSCFDFDDSEDHFVIDKSKFKLGRKIPRLLNKNSALSSIAPDDVIAIQNSTDGMEVDTTIADSGPKYQSGVEDSMDNEVHCQTSQLQEMGVDNEIEIKMEETPVNEVVIESVPPKKSRRNFKTEVKMEEATELQSKVDKLLNEISKAPPKLPEIPRSHKKAQLKAYYQQAEAEEQAAQKAAAEAEAARKMATEAEATQKAAAEAEAAQRVAAEAEGAKKTVAEVEAVKKAAAELEAAKKLAAEAKAARMAAVEAEAARMAAAEAEAARMVAAEAEAVQKAAAEAEAVQKAAAEAEAAQKAAAEAEAAKKAVAEAEAVQKATAELEAAKKLAAEAKAAKMAAAEAEAAQKVAAEAEAAQKVAAEAEAAQMVAAEAEAAQKAAAEAEAAKKAAAEAEAAQKVAAEAEAAQKVAAEAEAAQKAATEAEVVQKAAVNVEAAPKTVAEREVAQKTVSETEVAQKVTSNAKAVWKVAPELEAVENAVDKKAAEMIAPQKETIEEQLAYDNVHPEMIDIEVSSIPLPSPQKCPVTSQLVESAVCIGTNVIMAESATTTAQLATSTTISFASQKEVNNKTLVAATDSSPAIINVKMACNTTIDQNTTAATSHLPHTSLHPAIGAVPEASATPVATAADEKLPVKLTAPSTPSKLKPPLRSGQQTFQIISPSDLQKLMTKSSSETPLKTVPATLKTASGKSILCNLSSMQSPKMLLANSQSSGSPPKIFLLKSPTAASAAVGTVTTGATSTSTTPVRRTIDLVNTKTVRLTPVTPSISQKTAAQKAAAALAKTTDKKIVLDASTFQTLFQSQPQVCKLTSQIVLPDGIANSSPQASSAVAPSQPGIVYVAGGGTQTANSNGACITDASAVSSSNASQTGEFIVDSSGNLVQVQDELNMFGVMAPAKNKDILAKALENTDGLQTEMALSDATSSVLDSCSVAQNTEMAYKTETIYKNLTLNTAPIMSAYETPSRTMATSNVLSETSNDMVTVRSGVETNDYIT